MIDTHISFLEGDSGLRGREHINDLVYRQKVSEGLCLVWCFNTAPLHRVQDKFSTKGRVLVRIVEARR
jgi:hypothetical protein